MRALPRIGAFFCALGVMHFIETYLASVFSVSLPFGIVTSPGSTVLFTGKLMMLLLLYIREDAVVVRQPIYGLLFGNVLLFALAFVMRHHTLVALTPDRAADFGFLNEMGALMVWGQRSCSSTASSSFCCTSARRSGWAIAGRGWRCAARGAQLRSGGILGRTAC